jgi:soluble lytic murein transglycosylase
MTRARAAALLAAFAASCHGGPASKERPPVEAASATGIAVNGAMGGLQDKREGSAYQGVPRVSVVMADPRLAAAREREQSRDWAGAAQLLEAVSAGATLNSASACAWQYVAGRLHLAAGESSEAAAAFARVVSPGEGACPLAAYAALHESQALLRLGRYDDAISLAQGLGDEFAAHDDAQLVLADAYFAKGDRASAAPLWRSALSANPRGPRWGDCALQLATSLLDGVEGPPEPHANEALSLVTRILIEAPVTAEKVDALGIRARALALLGRHVPASLTVEERAQQAQVLLDGRQQKRAREVAEAVLKDIPRGAKEHREAACKAAIVRAQAKPRGKADEMADAWGAAIARCNGDDSLVTALYYGGKASASAHRTAEALERFSKVEKLFPQHRLADDACFRAALIYSDEGDEARGLALLASLPDTYPEGDMRSEALFRLGLAKLGKQDLDGAREALDRQLSAGLEVARGASGRAAYFRARVAQLAGDSDDARRRYLAFLADQPLGYYMLLAYARLRAYGEDPARSAMEAAIAREPTGAFLTRQHAELASPAFARFERLLEVGEVDAARRELHAAGLTGDGVDPEVLWTIAWLYNLAGAPELGHSFARTRLVEYREHWPAGRWRFAWEVAFPRPFEALVTRESESTHIPAPLTWAIMREESAFIPDARSIADAIGLMQLIAPTARATARGTQLPYDEEALRRPEISIALGTRLLSSLRASFPANRLLAIAAYNGGAQAVRRWLGERGGDDFDLFVERIPFDETRAYIKRVLASQAAYAYLYEPAALDELLTLPMHPSSDLVASPSAALP